MTSVVELGPYLRGDTKSFALSFTDGVNPIDMRGKTIRWQLKVAAAQADADAALTIDVTPEAGDAQAQVGEVIVTFEHSHTIGLVPGLAYSYSCRIIEPSTPEDVETTYFMGTMTFEDS